MIVLRRIAVVWLLAALLPVASAAEPRPHRPSDYSQVRVTLLTMGVGPRAHERFGHTAIRVLDPAARSDLVYNWGVFSFDEPGFLLKFFRGILIYRLGVRPYAYELRLARYLGKALWEDELTLTDAQKKRLVERILLNAQPANRKFPYQYFYNNCSTIPRDYIDQAVGGAVRRAYAEKFTGRTWRDFVRRHLQALPGVVLGLDLVMNSRVDREVTAWQEMFLPARLREYMAAMPAIDDTGKAIPGEPLLRRPRTVVAMPEPYPERTSDYTPLVLGHGAVLLAGLALLGLGRGRALGRRLLFAVAGSFGVVSGSVATVMAVSWAFSAHFDLHHNANLWLFWPWDILLIAPGIVGLIKSRVADSRIARGLRISSGAHLVGWAILLALATAGIVQQDVWRSLLWIGPIHLGVHGWLWRDGLRRVTDAAGPTPQEAA